MTNSANITNFSKSLRPPMDALRDMETPLWLLKGLASALRMMARHEEELDGELRDAVMSIQWFMENTVREMQGSFDSTFKD